VRTFLCGLALAVLLVPTPSLAAIVVRIGQGDALPGSNVVRLDVWADVPPGDTTDEKMDAFTIAIRGASFTPSGVRFLPVEPPSNAHPYVFGDSPGSEPQDFGSTPNQMQVGAAIATGGVDITPTRNGLFTIPVFVPPGTPFGPYTIAINPDLFSLGNVDATPGPPATIFLPEPMTSAAVPVLGTLILLRRRRPLA